MYACILSNHYHSMIDNNASIVNASGIEQLQAIPHVAGSMLSPGKPSRRAVTTLGSIHLVVCEVLLEGPSCQRDS